MLDHFENPKNSSLDFVRELNETENPNINHNNENVDNLKKLLVTEMQLFGQL